jgi:hypothetical protein
VGQRLAAADLGVENVNGLGRLLSQQLVMAGEQVVDVPASLSHRTRKLSGKSGRKTDEHDARSVAIAAAHPGRLRQVELEDFTEALGLILDRRWHLVTFRHRTICRLHALLAELIPGGAPKHLTAVEAAKILRSGGRRPVPLSRTLRRPQRHRPYRSLLRGRQAAPAQPGGNRQLNAAIHIAAVSQIRHDTDGQVFFRRKLTEHKTEGEAMRALKPQLSNVI